MANAEREANQAAMKSEVGSERVPSNTAARLGYGADDRILILHADDAGMNHSCNSATIRAMTEGIVSSASIMVPCPWFSEMAAWARENPQMDVGVHLTLTSEWKYYRWGPVAPRDKVKGLIDGEGYLWHHVEDVTPHASPKEVEIEARAQIERALEFGIKPTHIDSHMGTLFARPDYIDVYVGLSREFGIPAMLPRPSSKQLHTDAGQAIMERAAALESEGFLFLDRLITTLDGGTYEERKESFISTIRGLQPGVTQLIVHLNGDDPEAQNIAYSWRKRYIELLLCTEQESKELLEEEGIKLAGYRGMMDGWPQSA